MFSHSSNVLCVCPDECTDSVCLLCFVFEAGSEESGRFWHRQHHRYSGTEYSLKFIQVELQNWTQFSLTKTRKCHSKDANADVGLEIIEEHLSFCVCCANYCCCWIGCIHPGGCAARVIHRGHSQMKLALALPRLLPCCLCFSKACCKGWAQSEQWEPKY